MFNVHVSLPRPTRVPPGPQRDSRGLREGRKFRCTNGPHLGENIFGLGAIGRNGGHSDPPARMLIDINPSGLSPPTVLAVNRVLPRPSSPILFVKTDRTPARGDSRSGGFVQNISCVLKLGRCDNLGRRRYAPFTPCLLIFRLIPSSAYLQP